MITAEENIVSQSAKSSYNVEYDADKAEAYYEEKERLFENVCLPKELKKIDRWMKVNPLGKAEKLVNKLQKDYEDSLRQSGFFDRYPIPELEMSGIYIYLANSELFFETEEENIHKEKANFALQDVYEWDLDILNPDKIQRHIWINQKTLTDKQIWAFMAYAFMKTKLHEYVSKHRVGKYISHDADKGVATKQQEVENEQLMECDKCRISLHTIFNEKLRNNSNAIDEFMRIFSRVVDRVQAKGGHRTEKWCWRHVFYAFKDERLAFIDYETSNAAFGRAMAELCDTLKAKNVEQTLKTLVGFPSVTDCNIITDIVNTFMPVVDIIKGREASNRNG